MFEKKKLSKFTAVLGLFVAVTVFSGCARLPIAEPTRLHVGLTSDSDAAIRDGGLQDINTVLASETELFGAVSALSGYGIENRESLGDLIEEIKEQRRTAALSQEQAQKDPADKTLSTAQAESAEEETDAVDATEASQAVQANQAFVGIGGAFAEVLLSAAEESVGGDGNYDSGKVVSVDMWGKLTDYKLFTDWSGHLENETTAKIMVNGTHVRTMKFYWIVDVLPGVFEVHERDFDNELDPFKGTIALGDAMLKRVNEKGFDRKLWAEGDGIKVRKLLIDYGDDQGYQPVAVGDPLLEPDPNACIDMMFKALPDRPPGLDVPTTLAELYTHSYCLGRCRSPAMVNSK